MYFFIIFLINTKSVTSVQFGSVFESIPYTRSFSVTNLGLYIKKTFDEGCLNAPVDVLYVDLSRQFDYLNYLDDVIDENTVTILRFRYPVVTGNLPSFIKNKYQYLTNCLKFGDWDEDNKHDSEYFLMFY